MRRSVTVRLLVVFLTLAVFTAAGIPSVMADATPAPQPARHDTPPTTSAPATPVPASLTAATPPATRPSVTGTISPVAPSATDATRTRQAPQTSQSPLGRQSLPHLPNLVTPNPLPSPHPVSTTSRPGATPDPHIVLPYRNADFMRGINYVSYSTYGTGYATYDQIAPFIAPSGANWVSIVPTCFQDTSQSTFVSCDAAVNNAGGTGYTPYDSDVVAAITKAHAAGLKVMLKPQIDVRTYDFRGRIGFGTTRTNMHAEAQWAAWFGSYKTNIVRHYGLIAQANNVEAFILGTELVDTNTDPGCDTNPALLAAGGGSAQRGADWQALVTYLRTIYTQKDRNGRELTKIIYSANWGTSACAEVRSVNWWSSLDYIGVDAYYPLVRAPGGVVDPSISPTVADLIAGWTDDTAAVNAGIAPTTSLGQISAANGNKKVLLTEIGYQSQRGTTQQPSGIYATPEPPYFFAEQANAFKATFQALAVQPWLAGMFWWGAFITDPPFDPATDNNYPFFGKDAGNVLRNYYGVATAQPSRH